MQVNLNNCMHILSTIASTLLYGGSTRFTAYSPLDETPFLSDIMERMVNDNLSLDYVKQLLHNLQRDFQMLPSPIQVCLFLNIYFFVLWTFLPQFMMDNSSSSLKNMHSKRFWSSLLSNFSHQSLLHLLSNMSFLLTLGKPVCVELGNTVFIYTVLLSSFVCGYAPMIYEGLMVRLNPNSKRHQTRVNRMHIGFSGINMALAYLYMLLKPNEMFVLGYSDPMPFRTVFSVILWSDLAGLIIDNLLYSTGISHIGHLSGLLSGMGVRRVLCFTKWGNKLINWRCRAKICRPRDLF